MSKEYYRKRIIDLRASIEKERSQKKRDNEYYALILKWMTRIKGVVIFILILIVLLVDAIINIFRK